MTRIEHEQAARLAIGRLLRMMSRPHEPGDDNDYHYCRAIMLDAAEAIGMDIADNRPCYMRDRHRGVEGD